MTPIKGIKVFQVGDDWIAAKDADGALEYYREFMVDDMPWQDELDELKAEELTDECMDSLMHCGEDGEYGDKPITFREELLRDLENPEVTFPNVFASRDI